MPLDFPNDPVAGDIFADAGARWQWDGFKWTSLMTSGGPFLPLSGGALTGTLILAADPVVALHAATKQYVDGHAGISGYLPLTGGTLTGALMLTAMSTVIPPAGVGLLQGHAVNGTVIQGSGSASDFLLNNKTGTAVLSVPTGTVNLAAAGNVAVTGTHSFGSGLSIGTHTGNLATPTLQISGSGTDIGYQINTKGSNATVNLRSMNIGDNANGQGLFTNNNALRVNHNPTYAGGAGKPGLIMQQNVTGTLQAGVFYGNLFNIVDTVKLGASGDGSAGYMHQTNLTLNTGFLGARFALGASLSINGTSSNLATDTLSYYVALQGQATASVNDNGTGGSAHGNLFGGFIQANLTGTATNYYAVTGLEVDTGIATGCSSAYLSGINSILLFSNTVASANPSHSFAAGMQANATVGWDIAYQVGGPNGWWPIKPTGAVLALRASIIAGGPAMSCAYGVDFSLGTFTSAAFKSTGFQVDGAGNVTTPGLVGPFTVTGVVTHNSGINFGSNFAASTSDLSKHIALYSTTIGLNVSSGRLNIVTSAAAPIIFVAAGTDILSISPAGLITANSVRINGNAGFNNTTPIAKPTVSGAKASNAALASLIAALASYGLITDTTTA